MMKFRVMHKMALICLLAVSSLVATLFNYFQLMQEKLVLNSQIIAVFLFCVFMTILLIILGMRLSKALAQCEKVIISVKKGKSEARIELDSEDELWSLADNINQLLEERSQFEIKAQGENAAILALLQGVYKFSQRDLTTRLEVNEDITAPLANSLNLMADETARVLNGVVSIANRVSQATHQVRTQSDSVIKVASEEQHQVEQTADQLDEASQAMAAITTLARGCSHSADRAIQATENSLQSVLNTIQGITGIRKTIRETEKRIKRLGERSQDISGVVSLINSIAERTQILALNASIYAASAGETGRGFVVIADEIQRLAENSREATSRISTLVKNIQAETNSTVSTMNEAITEVVRGTQLAEQAGTAMRETRTNTSELVDKVQQITENSSNQMRITHELRNRADLIKKSTQRTNTELKDQSKQTELLVQYADGLTQAVSVFTLPDPESTQEAT